MKGLKLIHEGKTECTPRDAHYDQKAVDRLDAHCENLMNRGLIQAACYLLARDGRVFAHRSMGKMSSAPASADFMPDTPRPIESISKIFTAVCILKLMEEGRLFLHQPVSSLLWEFDTDMHRSITILHLLTHTAGIMADQGAFLEPYTGERMADWTKENWIAKVLTGPLQYKPGTVVNYSSLGFCILGEIVARTAGMDYTDYVKKNILDPLAMNDSCYFPEPAARTRICVITESHRKRLEFTKETMITTSVLAATRGGMFSSVGDLFRFGRMLLNNGTSNGRRILGRKTVEAATRPRIRNIVSHNWQPDMFGDGIPATYGLGFELNKHSFLPEGTFDHEGAGGSLLYIDPEEKFLFAGFFPSADWHAESSVSPLAIAWSGLE